MTLRIARAQPHVSSYANLLEAKPAGMVADLVQRHLLQLGKFM